MCSITGGKKVAVDKPAFRALALYENGGHHVAFSAAAHVWLDKLALQNAIFWAAVK